MNRLRSDAIAAALCGLLLLGPSAVRAHEGHDHDEAPPAAAVSAGGPRFALATDLFEVVGALDGRRLTLWVDRSADNAPVTDASIDLQVDGRTVALERRGDAYVGELDAAPRAGRLPVAVTVMAGSDADVFAGELVVEAASDVAMTGSAAGGASAPRVALTPEMSTAAIAAAAALVAAAAGWLAGRRSGRRAPGDLR